jgi:hypothetical protein
MMRSASAARSLLVARLAAFLTAAADAQARRLAARVLAGPLALG